MLSNNFTLLTKQKKGAEITALASHYQLVTNPVPVIMPTSTSTSPVLRIGDKTVNFRDFPIEEVPSGVEIEVQSGMMNLDISTNTQRRNLYLREGAVIILHSDGSVEVKKGLVGADFSVKVKTPTAQVTPAGTVFTVEVTESGETRVQTFEGQVRVESKAAAIQTLDAGQQVAVSDGGALGEIGTFDVETAHRELSPAPDMPFDLSSLDVKDEKPRITNPNQETDLIGIGLIAALAFSLGLLILFLLLVAARSKRRPAPVAAPQPAAAGWRQVYPEPRSAQRTVGAELIVCQGPSAGLRIPLGSTIRVGRASDNDIVLGDPQASRHHAVIAATRSGYVLTDQGSANGTWVNGVRLAQPHQLRHGDVIALGGQQWEFQASSLPEARPLPRL